MVEVVSVQQHRELMMIAAILRSSVQFLINKWILSSTEAASMQSNAGKQFYTKPKHDPSLLIKSRAEDSSRTIPANIFSFD